MGASSTQTNVMAFKCVSETTIRVLDGVANIPWELRVVHWVYCNPQRVEEKKNAATNSKIHGHPLLKHGMWLRFQDAFMS